MVRSGPTVPELGAAIIRSFSVALRHLATVQGKLGSATSVAPDLARFSNQVYRPVVDAGVTITVFLAAPAEAVLEI